MTNHASPDPLNVAESALRELPAHILPTTETLNHVATLAINAEKHSPPTDRVTTSSDSWRKFAALLLTSAALVAISYSLLQSTPSAFAFEDVVTAVRNASTVSYTTVITPPMGPTTQYKNDHQGSLTRMSYADGSYSVLDMAGQKMLMVHPTLKTATITKLGNKPKELPNMGESIIAWLKTAEQSGKPVGEKTINGVRTIGFEASFGATTMTLWGDPATKLPVQIESTIGPPSEPIQMVMRDFVFNAPLPEALFSMEIPEGFQTKDLKQPEVDYAAIVKLAPEEHVVRILRFYAKLHDGSFPERIDGPELVSKLSFAARGKTEEPEFMKDMTTLAASMGATWTFRQTLNKFGYVGTAHLNDANSIVFWYLPKDAQKYRVVFADLTIGDVSEDQLPAPAAK